MHITRLRLLGFKSFVEPAELVIERGLTGVVGPNGCGKSNLLEALRWVMGETSYKNMRASSMEDVIFSGTNKRPARNIAQVTIALDNRDRKAHPAFNDDDNLEITRRIERDHGSQYQINGKPVRARDVQLLFADASTGAHSPALVQQGRIGEIVSAKPAQRRFVLEEAAGITGLHSRRHEAEIKLRGAQNNLERLRDIMGQMESRLSALRRQERQVVRYRDLSRQIEKLQILHYYLDFLDYQSVLQEAEEHHTKALLVVGEKTKAESTARQLQIEASQKLPDLRQREMVCAAIVQRLTIEAGQLEKEHQSQQNRKDELSARRTQIEADTNREQQTVHDERQRLEDFNTELQALQNSAQKDPDTRLRTVDVLNEAEAELAQAEQDRLANSQHFAEQKAQLNALHREQGEKLSHAEQISQQRIKLAQEFAQLRQQLEKIADFDELATLISRLGEQVQGLDEGLQNSERALQNARTAENEALRQHMQSDSTVQTLTAQISTLEKLLQSSSPDDARPLLEDIKVAPGYEMALAASLGDDLEASLNDKADLYWRQLDKNSERPAPLPPLPEGTLALFEFVNAPEALALRLQMTGIIERGRGDELQSKLFPGQRLVSVEGDLWRWDGYGTRADAPTMAARKLAEKNRLEELRTTFNKRQQEAQKTKQAHELARTRLTELELTHTDLQKQHTERRTELEQKRRELTEAERLAASQRARLEAISSTKAELVERHQVQSQRLEQIEAELAQASDLEQLETRLGEQTVTLGKLRTAYHEAKAQYDRLEQEQRTRQSRSAHLQSEIKRITARLDQSDKYIKTLEERQKKEGLELDGLLDLPDQTKARRSQLETELAKAEQQRKTAADQLQEGENVLREIERSLQSLQAEAMQAREQRAAFEARREAASSRLAEQSTLITAELECAPDECPQKAGLTENEKLPGREQLVRDLARASKDRERLGGVNLRAEMEARELAREIEEMGGEHRDLTEAINALRTAISGLNKEGRRRL
ncbi:MAG: AAA family ATPase, partial [Hyphomicrobiaceae bacterium]|nr:AAA family ATPase [Hyphomicrobiaceae bacterium]